ncbi:MAG TPA: hypothetical protein VLZ31_07220 [Microbacteriaceae bacterium]|nr:hypothetical protein [Microbacteriaceae bacterium]
MSQRRFPRNSPLFVLSVGVLAASLALTGCTPSGEDVDDAADTTGSVPQTSQEQQSGQEAEEPQQQEEPAQESIAVRLPGCEVIDFTGLNNANDLVAEDIVDSAELLIGGPVAQTSIQNSLQKTGCLIYLPNSGYGLKVITAELTDQDLASFTDALQSSDYIEYEHNGVQTFHYLDTSESEVGEGYELTIYSFIGTVMVGELSGGMGVAPETPAPSVYMEQLIDAVIHNNPHLTE